VSGLVKFGNNTDHQFNQALNMLAQSRSLSTSGLGAGQAGLFAYNSGRLYVLNAAGSAFELIATDSDLLEGENGAFYLDLANASGQLPASSVSGLAAAITATPINDLATPDGDIAMGGFKITGLADGVAGSDAAAWGQVQDLFNNRSFKDPVRAATTGPITLSGTQTVDNVALIAGNRALVKDQADAGDNGIYVVAAGAWSRATDFDDSLEALPGSIISVQEGDDNGDKLFILATNGPITIGTTDLTFSAYGASSGEIGIAGAGLTKTGSTYDVGAGTGITVNANDVAIDPAVVTRVVRGTVPSGGSPSVNIVHGLSLGTNAHIASLTLIERSTQEKVEFGWETIDGDTVEVTLPAAPTSNQWDWTVTG
jgi:hypothetical protein